MSHCSRYPCTSGLSQCIVLSTQVCAHDHPWQSYNRETKVFFLHVAPEVLENVDSFPAAGCGGRGPLTLPNIVNIALL